MIHFKNVSYQYPTRNTPTIRNVNFDIDRGDFVLVSGPTGCGKTTLIKMLNGIIPHLSKGVLCGEVVINGKSTIASPMKKLTGEVGLVFQSPDDQIVCTAVEEEIAFGPENQGLGYEEIEKRIAWAMDVVGISDLRKRDTNELSGGQKQRVVIASQIAMRPSILALDEPLSQLDPKGAGEVMQCIKQLNKEGITIIMIEHRIAEVVKFARKIMLIDKGEICYFGEIEQSFEKAGDVYKRLGIQIPDEVRLAKMFNTGRINFDLGEIVREIKTKNIDYVQILNCACEEPAFVCKDLGNQLKNKKEETIVISNVSFHYKKETNIFSNLNLILRKGETTVLMGANGTGKSTLLSLIAGMNLPDKGIVKVDGIDTKKKSARKGARHVGLLFQNPDLMLFCETVEKELTFGPKNKRILQKEILLRLDSILKRLHIVEHKDDSPFALSMGQRLRVALGAILTMQLPILLLDEPTTGQNIENVARLMNTLKNLSFVESIIFCTHDVNVAMKYADRIIVLNHGGIAADGSPAEVLRNFDLLEKSAIRIPASIRLAKLLDLSGKKDAL